MILNYHLEQKTSYFFCLKEGNGKNLHTKALGIARFSFFSRLVIDGLSHSHRSLFKHIQHLKFSHLNTEWVFLLSIHSG